MSEANICLSMVLNGEVRERRERGEAERGEAERGEAHSTETTNDTSALAEAQPTSTSSNSS
jgi:hypothetical protein